MGDDGPPRIDEHDRRVGLAHLRALRAELRHTAPADESDDEVESPRPADTASGRERSDTQTRPVVDPEPEVYPSVAESTDGGQAVARPMEQTAEPVAGKDGLNTYQMAAEMAAAAERELLERRIVALESEVASLRQALAAILTTAASAVAHDASASDDVDGDGRSGDVDRSMKGF